MWKRKSRKCIYKAKNADDISILVDHIQLASGKEFDITFVDSPYEVIFIIGIDDINRVLLLKQYRYLVEKTLIEVPAGSPKPGETLEIGACREFEEEAGYQIGKLTKIGSFFSSVGMTNQLNHIYLATDIQKTIQSLGEGEIIEILDWLPIEEAVQLVYQGKILNVGSAYGILLASAWLKENRS